MIIIQKKMMKVCLMKKMKIMKRIVQVLYRIQQNPKKGMRNMRLQKQLNKLQTGEKLLKIIMQQNIKGNDP